MTTNMLSKQDYLFIYSFIFAIYVKNFGRMYHDFENKQ